MKYKYEDLMLILKYLEKNCQYQNVEIYVDERLKSLIFKTAKNDNSLVTLTLPNEERNTHVLVAEEKWLSSVK